MSGKKPSQAYKHMNAEQDDCVKYDDYVTVKELAKSQTAFSESSLRYHIFHEHDNGLHKYIRRIGRKVLISQKGFQLWIENGGKA